MGNQCFSVFPRKIDEPHKVYPNFFGRIHKPLLHSPLPRQYGGGGRVYRTAITSTWQGFHASHREGKHSSSVKPTAR